MKKTILILMTLCTLVLNAQENSEQNDLKLLDENRHEFRIDAAEGLIVPAIDINYEYIISKYSGVGVGTYIGLNDGDNNYQDFAISPYYRQYFFNKKDFGARGFFGEGVVQYSTGKAFERDFFGNETFDETTWNAFGIGFAIGQKWVSNNGFVIEISLGGGRNFGTNDITPEGFFRGGVSVGYRF